MYNPNIDTPDGTGHSRVREFVSWCGDIEDCDGDMECERR